MKFMKNVFLMMCFASVFSLSYVNNGLAKACNKKEISAGHYCVKGGTEYLCPANCYCDGTSNKEGLSAGFNVKDMCEKRWKNEDMRKQAYDVGIHQCGKTTEDGKEYDLISNEGSKSKDNCYKDVSEETKGGDAYEKLCKDAPDPGTYCKQRGTHKTCPVGCYCPGYNRNPTGNNMGEDPEAKVESYCKGSDKNKDTEEYLNSRGVFHCPKDYTSSTGAKAITDCYDTDTMEDYVEPAKTNVVTLSNDSTNSYAAKFDDIVVLPTSLSLDQLKYGINGRADCWLKTKADDYKKCVYGN